ncbi:MAG: phospholipase D-like domain-containing protein [Elusimicrobiaceae bacterium]|nr:phospholipase D-like domain-containing protein [Elusimicrobiaceae bacterium]
MKKLFIIFSVIAQMMWAPVSAGAQGSVAWDGAGSVLGARGRAALGAVAVPGVSAAKPAAVASAKTAKAPALKAPRVVFSEDEYISGHILKNINNCTKTLDVAVYAFSLRDVAEAIVKAIERGVQVRVIVDQSHMFGSRTAELQYLVDNNVNLRVLRGTGKWGIMHNKMAIFDGKMVKFGSFNWTNAGDRNNYENAIFNTEPAIIAGYQAYFDWMWEKTRSVADGPLEGDVPWGSYGKPPADSQPSLEFNGAAFPRYAFSPLGGSEDAIISAIDKSQAAIHICMYSLFSQNIGDALLNAKNRGIDVRIVMDRLQAGSSPLTEFFIKNKFVFKWNSGYSGRGVMHHKFGIFDGKMVVTGSFNWTSSAENNNLENDYYTDNAQDVKAFAGEFNTIFGKAFTPTEKDL